MTEPDALFPVPSDRFDRPGPVEVRLRAQLDTAAAEGRLDLDLDGALAESALVLARAVDYAGSCRDRIKGGYLAAQAQPALQKALHALRLPVELTAATPPAPQPDPEGPGALAEWWNDLGGALGPS